MPKLSRRFACPNPRCKWSNSIRDMTIRHMQQTPSCTPFLKICRYCNTYFGFDSTGLKIHLNKSINCGRLYAFYQNPGNLDPAESVKRSKKIPDNHHIAQVVKGSCKTDKSKNLTEKDPEMLKDVVEYNADDEEDSDFDIADVVVRSISQQKKAQTQVYFALMPLRCHCGIKLGEQIYQFKSKLPWKDLI